MRTIGSLAIAAMACGLCQAALAQESKQERKAQEKRKEINSVAEETLQKLLNEDPAAKKLYDESYGYAVFDNFKLSLFLASEKGRGVAVVRKTGDRTYMRMGSLGVNVGLGGQKMQVIFLFEDKDTLDDFVNKGWQADASAEAAAGQKGTNVEAEFVDGMATYQFTEKGVMLQASLAGTKYWKGDKLN